MRHIWMFLAFLALAPVAVAMEDFSVAKALIDQNVPCDQLSANQLEALGDYYMEQIHPGEIHERMDAMMGGEGSDSLRQMHIRMGEAFYCGNVTAGYGAGMMGGYGLMGGMMGYRSTDGAGMMGYADSDSARGMMGRGTYARDAWSWFLCGLAFIAASLAFSIIFWGTYKLMLDGKKRR